MMKGIILAGGQGTRLMPSTWAVCKQLLPVYDKPMIYYPLSTLLEIGISDILIISTPEDLPRVKDVLGDGSRFGITLSYLEQKAANGIAEAFIIGAPFIGNDSVCLVLGDNIFYGAHFKQQTIHALKSKKKASIFGYHVRSPERYGVIELDAQQRPISIVEKPSTPKSNWAVTGLYFYEAGVCKVAQNLTPSKRGELEITDVNAHYLEKGELHVELLSRGNAWLDAGTPESLLKASQFIHAVEERQGLKIGCIEEIAYRNGFIDRQRFLKDTKRYGNSDYGKYLNMIADEL